MKLIYLMLCGLFFGGTLIYAGKFTVQYGLGEDYTNTVLRLLALAVCTVIWKHNADNEE